MNPKERLISFILNYIETDCKMCNKYIEEFVDNAWVNEGGTIKFTPDKNASGNITHFHISIEKSNNSK